MTKISDLTEKQFKELLDGYFAPPVKRSKMSDEEIKDLAKRLDDKIDIPLVSATKEEKIFIKVVIKIDRFLYDNLPNEFYDLIRSLDKGIDDDEAKRLAKRLAMLANKHIDIPYIPESVEYLAMRFIIGIVLNAARKNWDFLKAKDNALKMNVSGVENATDQDLENMIL